MIREEVIEFGEVKEIVNKFGKPKYEKFKDEIPKKCFDAVYDDFKNNIKDKSFLDPFEDVYSFEMFYKIYNINYDKKNYLNLSEISIFKEILKNNKKQYDYILLRPDTKKIKELVTKSLLLANNVYVFLSQNCENNENFMYYLLDSKEFVKKIQMYPKILLDENVKLYNWYLFSNNNDLNEKKIKIVNIDKKV